MSDEETALAIREMTVKLMAAESRIVASNLAGYLLKGKSQEEIQAAYAKALTIAYPQSDNR